MLKKGESQKISFTLNEDDFAVVTSDLQRVVEPGEFTVMVGSASNNIKLEKKFILE